MAAMETATRIAPDAAASILRWWDEAGAGAPVAETPYAWLRAPAARAEPPAAAATPAPAALPDTLDAFVRWRSEGDDAPEARWGAARLAPFGTGRALMILVDMPEAEDRRTLLEGAVGRLFDRMLAAIGHDRSAAYVAALAWARPPGGVIDDADGARLTAFARHHVALVRPERLLLMGGATSRALIGTDVAAARGRQHPVHPEHADLRAIVTHPPRLLIKTPAAKAAAWRDLLLLTRDPLP